MIVIADTSPINYLILIGYTDILRDLFSQVILPQAVWKELNSADAPEVVRNWVNQRPEWLVIETVEQIDEALNELDEGEKEAIALAQELGCDLLIIDEKRGREKAVSRGLKVVGTLGVLDQARNLIDIEDAVRRLQQTSFRASPKLWKHLLDPEN
ncbi:MAG: DUF3368 domain-containing protein [Acidobacteriota bacterium]